MWAQSANEIPDVAEVEARFEAAFAAALAMPDDTDPLHAMQAWGAVMMSATMLDRVRAVTEPGNEASIDDPNAAAESVLDRWRRAKPDSGGPALFRAFRIEDQAAKRDATMALLDQFPDDPLVLWQGLNSLRHEGDVTRATSLAEGFLARNPEHPLAYRLLFQTTGINETRQVEILRRWATARPADPVLVARWMGSSLPDRDPDTTRRLVNALLDSSPSGSAGLQACVQVLRAADAELVRGATSCVARLASDPSEDEATATRATRKLAELAAKDGNWSAMIAALDTLDPEARFQTLISAASRLEPVARCTDGMELLGAAKDALEGLERGHRGLASALLGCADHPEARSIFFALLRRAPVERASSVATAWATRVNGRYVGELPLDAAAILEARLAETGSATLFPGLDAVYRLHTLDAKRLALLHRWRTAAPESFDGERAIDLARAESARGRVDVAADVLEAQLLKRAESEVADALFDLYLQSAGEARAERLATDLVATGEPGRTRIGHTLAARSALLRDDPGAAETHYWRALEGSRPPREVAVELLSLTAWSVEDRNESDAGRQLQAVAQRICQETDIATTIGPAKPCVAHLLTATGGREIAAVLAGEALPEDLRGLREMAQSARSAGQAELAERALKRILELDPEAEQSWVGYADFLGKAGRIEELTALVEASRAHLSPTPTTLDRIMGRALTAANRPEAAIEILREARRKLPDTAGGGWSRSWIDHELRSAYATLGDQILATRAGENGAPDDADSTLEDLATLLAGDDPSAEDPAAGDRIARLLDHAAERDHVLAVEMAGLLYSSGIGVRRDMARARDLIDQAARLGSDGIPRLAAAARRTPWLATLLERVWPVLEDQAATGESSASASALYARLAFIGAIPDVDRDRVVALARRAAEAGEPMAMRVLARALERGIGVEKDEASGLRWQRRCAEAGNAYCMMFEAHDLIEGEVLEKDPARGLRWLEQAEATGNWWATAELARVYAEGRPGIESDPEKAVPLRCRLAARGDAESLGWLQAHGIGQSCP